MMILRAMGLRPNQQEAEDLIEQAARQLRQKLVESGCRFKPHA